MEPEEATTTEHTSLSAVIADWTPEDIDKFMRPVSCDWKARLDDVDQHMEFRPEHHTKESHGGERPMYRLNKHYYDARRISSILFNETDPWETREELTMACNHQYCIHRRHMVLTPRKPSNKRRDAF